MDGQPVLLAQQEMYGSSFELPFAPRFQMEVINITSIVANITSLPSGLDYMAPMASDSGHLATVILKAIEVNLCYKDRQD